MTTSYDLLFRVQISHEYYDSGFASDFELVPTATCAATLKQLGFLFKQEEFGFLVLARVQSNTSPPVLFNDLSDRNLRLTFEMRLRNPAFYNITDMTSYGSFGEVFYFSNLENVLNNDIHTLRDQVANANVGNSIPVIAGQFQNLGFTTAITMADIEVRDVFNVAKTSVPQLALSPTDTTNNFQIDLAKIDDYTPGRYRTTWQEINNPPNTESGQVEVLYEPKLSGNNTIGIIELFNYHPSQPAPNNPRFLNGNTLLQPTYQVQFAAHAPVHWHYILIVQNQINNLPTLAGLSIAGFSQVALPNGFQPANARILRSDNPINVRQSLPNFTLNTDKPNFSINLPTPAPNANLKSINGLSPAYEIFVYI